MTAIQAVDDEILAQMLALFPGGGSSEALEKLSDDDIRAIINDGGPNLHKVHLCMRGTTVVVSLVDPEAKDLWIASLGDSVAGKFLIRVAQATTYPLFSNRDSQARGSDLGLSDHE